MPGSPPAEHGRVRVLYVEDDRLNAMLFEAVCEIAGGIELSWAETGAEALARAQSFMPHALVIDLRLPDTDGIALLSSLRERCADAGLQAWLCTAESGHEVVQRASAAGFEGCLDKPVDLAAVHKLRAALAP